MSRRNKRRAQALQREKEILSQPVRTDGHGESGLVADYMQQFAGASHTESAELALALDRFLKGDYSLLQDPAQMERLSRFRDLIAKRQDAERRWEEDKGKFAADLFRKADKIMPVKDERERTIARGIAMEQDALHLARANRSTKQLQLRALMEHGPKREVFVTGIPLQTDAGLVIAPEVINVMGIQMVLRPGKHTISEVFAQRLDQMQAERLERAARDKALGDNLRADQLALRWAQIGEEFGSVSVDRQSENELLGMPGMMT